MAVRYIHHEVGVREDRARKGGCDLFVVFGKRDREGRIPCLERCEIEHVLIGTCVETGWFFRQRSEHDVRRALESHLPILGIDRVAESILEGERHLFGHVLDEERGKRQTDMMRLAWDDGESGLPRQFAGNERHGVLAGSSDDRIYSGAAEMHLSGLDRHGPIRSNLLSGHIIVDSNIRRGWIGVQTGKKDSDTKRISSRHGLRCRDFGRSQHRHTQDDRPDEDCIFLGMQEDIASCIDAGLERDPGTVVIAGSEYPHGVSILQRA